MWTIGLIDTSDEEVLDFELLEFEDGDTSERLSVILDDVERSSVIVDGIDGYSYELTDTTTRLLLDVLTEEIELLNVLELDLLAMLDQRYFDAIFIGVEQ